MEDSSFRTELVSNLRKLSSEAVPDKLKDLRASLRGEKNSSSPKLVTELLMAILAANGNLIDPERIHKRIRDDVCSSSTAPPWRRSPFWLVLKVGLPTSLTRLFPNDECHAQYKNFMCFLVAKICRVGCTQTLPPDDIHVIMSKVARKVLKLGLLAFDTVLTEVQEICRQGKQYLDHGWKLAQEHDNSQRDVPEICSSEVGSTVRLNNSSKYLASRIAQCDDYRIKEAFTPSCSARIPVGQSELPASDILSIHSADLPLALMDFERWVCLDLEHVEIPCTKDSAKTLSRLIESYITLSKKAYLEMSEQLSIMLLTVLELLVVLDKLVLEKYPLLAECPLDLQTTILEPCILAKLGQMERLSKIENYLDSRHCAANAQNPSVFSDTTERSFGVRYYDQSTAHQALRSRIEEDAKKERSEKKREWEKLNDQYNSLSRQATELAHSTQGDDQGRQHYCVYDCQKCAIERQMASMKIMKHEWPLPNDEVQLKASIFEIMCPTSFVEWRSALWLIVHDLGRGPGPGARNPQKQDHGSVLDYSGLKSYVKSVRRRITLVTTAKPFMETSFAVSKFPVAIESICINNGLQLSLFDSSNRVWIRDQRSIPSFHHFCDHVVPSGRYDHLGYAINGTGHTPNEAVTSQSDCPTNLNIHEHYTFASLRAGERIQWPNILLSLSSPNLAFNQEEVYTLMIHASCQAGPSSEDSCFRLSHDHFAYDSFTDALLSRLDKKFNLSKVIGMKYRV